MRTSLNETGAGFRRWFKAIQEKNRPRGAKTDHAGGYATISHSGRAAILASACFISIAAVVPNANAQGKFDGAWSTTLYTSSGACAPSARTVVQVVDGIVHVEGASANSFSGHVSQAGSVTLTVSLAGIYGVGTGRLSSNSGGGKWRAQLQNAPCSGTWSAQRN
jgi:hypothetical protein